MSIRFYSSSLGGRQLQHLYRFFQELDQRFRTSKAQNTSLPSICVGNFQAGGTGKTPTSLWLAKSLEELGYSPYIVLRGYRGTITSPTLVTAGHGPLEVGDEALLHASAFPTVVGADRLGACQLASKLALKAPKPVLVLDDGLQHYPLRADFNIVCTKSPLFWEDTLLPIGRLRQIPTPDKIDAVIVINTDAPNDWRGVPIHRISQRSEHARGPSAPGLILAGLAHPDHFFQSVQAQFKTHTLPTKAFRDHHKFTAKDLWNLELTAAAMDYVVHCTAKDAVKLEPLIAQHKSRLNLSVWDLKTTPNTDAAPLLQAVVSKIEEVYAIRPIKGQQKA